jgi:hypothetical protein
MERYPNRLSAAPAPAVDPDMLDEMTDNPCCAQLSEMERISLLRAMHNRAGQA